ncbi:hypothetical protein D3C84_539940 [compost metagenome]
MLFGIEGQITRNLLGRSHLPKIVLAHRTGAYWLVRDVGINDHPTTPETCALDDGRKIDFGIGGGADER